MASNDEKWYFTKEQLENSPSRKCGIDAYKELQYRQQAANFIQNMGQRLKVTQLCINTGIVYMHRFYVFHSFTHFPWQSIAAAALFLAAKVEEQPRKLEHVIKVVLLCKNHNNHANFDVNSERYQSLSQDLVFNENILLQTLGFDVAIDHPHTHVVKCCHLVRARADLAQTSYFLASNSLHLTTMCLQYRPTVVACFCILLACKWSNWEIPLSNEQKEWFSYVDPTVTSELLQQLCLDFLEIYDRCPSRLKEKVMIMQTQDNEKKNMLPGDSKEGHGHRSHHTDKIGHLEDPHKHRSSRPHDPSSSSSNQQQREREHRERKERERMAQHAKQALPGQGSSGSSSSSKQMPPHGHHRPPLDQKMKHEHGRASLGSNTSNRPPDPTRLLHESLGKDLRDYRHDPLSQRSEKDMQKRDYMQKQNISDGNVNSYDNRAMYGSSEKPIDPSRSRSMDPTKYPPKHESTRRHEDKPLFPKTNDMSDMNKQNKHFSASGHDKNNPYDKNSAYANKPMTNATSHKKPPYDDVYSKMLMQAYPKMDSQNGSSANTSGYAPPGMDMSGNSNRSYMETTVKPEIKEDIAYYQQKLMPTVKKPSLFSPEKSPPKKMLSPIQNGPPMKMLLEDLKPEPGASLFDPIEPKRPKRSSEEMRPALLKLDQMEGFENLMTESSIGLKLSAVPDIITPLPDDLKVENHEDLIAKEMKPPDIIPPFNTPQPIVAPIVNSIETNPTLISNLLKEAPSVAQIPSIAPPEPVSVEKAPPLDEKERSGEHHHKSKKKNKEKHKHKDKNRDKKKKHKDKDKEKHKKSTPEPPPVAQPIKITISKDKIQPPETPPPPVGLKIKIPKDRLKNDIADPPPLPPAPIGGLKIKIPKDVIKNNSFGGESRKRDREKEKSSPEAPPSKAQKSSYRNDGKQNGRHSYNKVTHLGDGDVSNHRLAESKYSNKGATS